MTESSNEKPIIWSISGSDCSGGAGIAADIKTGHSLDVEVCHLMTANTVQNANRLTAINATEVTILAEQAAILIDDKPPSVIKIGLLANAEQVQWLTNLLVQYKQRIPTVISVYDPVGQASVGGRFNDLTVAQLTPLLQQVDIITPNLAEAQQLLQPTPNQLLSVQGVITRNHAENLAHGLYQQFAITSIIIKGGHSDDKSQAEDYCYHQLNQLPGKQDNQDKIHTAISYQLSAPRSSSMFSHGGGCSFASALSAFLAHGYLVRDAFTLAKAFMSQGLFISESRSASLNHQYYGAFQQQSWPRVAVNTTTVFPKVSDALSEKHSTLAAFASLDLVGKKLGLYPVIDSLYWLKRLLPLGLEIIQLRLKNIAEDTLDEMIADAITLAKQYNTRLFINDYWQLAIKHGAYGVHIGQEDIQTADLAAIQEAGIRLGISTHGCYEFVLAQQLQPSYLAIGAIFATQTKDMTGQIQGLDNLKQVLTLRPKFETDQTPVVAIGGITLELAQSVATTGVDSIAVVTAITQAQQSHNISPESMVAKLQAIAQNPKV
jgi:hydroxymethylpyrimidine kinase/phosphomethylpyrimidine kinase/thiamine-phosphate diphosphorylase